ncbi:helix-turn-helix transcriptional regulator [Serratia fonticola]|uniref:helix-turn-helix transcriptional regulator n=1 Tax=Serratia fonticola TaxID=47917 RepID=UPI0015C64112|nr:helix-turn-helix transcriptional regulator [Serratia fonticola]MBC3378944.1 helix-turn-helix transcriptional regulator [Serratia fonticola]NYA38144.1 helix-turn-helix transcriptional regulator [Serratia fonticola]
MDSNIIRIHSDNTYAKIALQSMIDDIDFIPNHDTPIDIYCFSNRNIIDRDIVNINITSNSRYIIIGHCHVLNCFSSNDDNINSLLIDIFMNAAKVKIELMHFLHILSRGPSHCKPAFTLTEKELSVVKHIAKGIPIPLIAKMKKISTKTISTHKRSAMRKMNARTTQIMLVKYKIHQQTLRSESIPELHIA